jgi:hypothetical protein
MDVEGDAPVSADEANITTDEEVFVDTETTNIYAETYVETGVYYTPSYTILYSLNNILGTDANNKTPILYKPKIEDLPFLQEKISKMLEIAVVYGGYFNLNGDKATAGRNGVTGEIDITPQDGFVDPETKKYKEDADLWRALQILGFDMYLYSESLNLSRAQPDDPTKATVTQNFIDMDAADFSTRFALMSMYKALGKNFIKMQVITKPNIAYAPNYVKIDNLPITEKITVPIDGLDGTKGLSYVYLTRTRYAPYLERAKDDGIIDFGTYDILDDNDTDDRYKKEGAYHTISKLDFLYYLQKLLYHYGEPVLTDQEENYLLEAYGRYLPSALDPKYLYAIRYLVARGIVEAETDFYGKLTVRDMLVILMRAADKESRLTFKTLEVEYDKSLISQGYFPTEVAVPVGITLEKEDESYSAKEYYDFLVEFPNNLFSGSGAMPENRDMYVAATGTANDTSVLKGSQYLGVKRLYNKSFYHFRIPVASGLSTVYIKARGSGDSVSIVNGGGFYYYSNNRSPLPRNKFVATDDESFVDIDRKNKALLGMAETDKIYLAPGGGASSVVVRIPAALVEEATFEGEPLNEVAVAGFDANGTPLQNEPDGDVIRLTKTGNPVRYKIKNLGDIREIQDKLKVNTASYNGKAVDYFQMYITLGDKDNMFVNVDYLQDCNVLTDYVEVEDGVLLLHSNKQTIILDKNAHRIVSGNTVIDTSTKSQLWTKSNNQLFVDYRAVIGWTARYLLISDEEGRVNIAPIDDMSRISSTYLKSPFNQTLQLVTTNGGTAGSSLNIILSGTDPLAPYIIYQNQRNGRDLSIDRIYSFKVATNYGSFVDPSPTNSVESNLKFKMPEELWVLENALSTREGTTDNPEGISYTEYGYVYKPPSKSEFDINKHYGQRTGTATGILPGSAFIPYFLSDTVSRGSASVLNFNMNVMYSIDTGKDYAYGEILQQYTGQSRFSAGDVLNAKDWSTVSTGANLFMVGVKAAPTAMWLYATNIDNVSVSKALRLSSKLYYGTMDVTLRSLTHEAEYMLCAITMEHDTAFKALASISDVNELLFRPVIWGSSEATLAYDSYDVQPVYTKEKEKPGTSEGERHGLFDFRGFMFNTFLRNFDDSLTISVIFILNLLPRFFMFLFIVLMALACIARAPVWRKFCASIFDPYKIITAGRQSCETIELVPLFVCSIIALAMFGLFQNGLILDLVGWIVRAVTGILDR